MSVTSIIPISAHYQIAPIFPMLQNGKVGTFQYNYTGMSNPEWFDIDIYWNRPHTCFYAEEWASFSETDPHASFAFYLQIIPILKQKKAWFPPDDMWIPVCAMSHLAQLHTDSFRLERIHEM